jgi:hypothetical protein
MEFNLEPDKHSAFVTSKGEQIGVRAVGIVVLGLAFLICACLVALGIAAVRWAL